MPKAYKDTKKIPYLQIFLRKKRFLHSKKKFCLQNPVFSIANYVFSKEKSLQRDFFYCSRLVAPVLASVSVLCSDASMVLSI